MKLICAPEDITEPWAAAVPSIGAQSLDQVAEWIAAHPWQPSGGLDPFALAHAYDVAHPVTLPVLPPAEQIDPFAQWWASHHPVEVIGVSGGATSGFGM